MNSFFLQLMKLNLRLETPRNSAFQFCLSLKATLLMTKNNNNFDTKEEESQRPKPGSAKEQLNEVSARAGKYARLYGKMNSYTWGVMGFMAISAVLLG